MIPTTKRGLWEMLVRSITENDRFSPRLLTTFAFSGAALLMLRHGALTPPVVLNGAVVTGWPPEYIWNGLIFLVISLLLGGKAAEAFVSGTKIKAEAAVAAAEATGQQPGGPAVGTAENVTVTNPPAGQ